MGINATINKREEPESSEYPCLKISNGLVVLFTKQRTGTAIVLDSSWHKIGRFSDAWIESNFKPFQGSVTLENE